MSKMKAVVLEKSGSRYTVLGRDGTFRQVHRQLCAEVGEEIEIRTGIDIFGGLRMWAGVAALFLLVLTTLFGWSLYQAPTAVALLSVDINPSLQFTIDAQGQILKLQSQNEDAKRMLSQIDLKGKSIEEVLEQIVTQAYDQKFLSSEQYWVVIGYSPMTNKTLKQMPKELNETQIISWVTEISEKKGLTSQVAVFSLTSQERELSRKVDLTLGEYALWQTADKAGVVTQPEKLKDTSERVRLLENPQVQVQIKTEKNERQDSESIKKPSENGTGKDQDQDKKRQNDQKLENDNANDEDKQRGKNQEKDQDKNLNKGLSEVQNNNIDIPPILTPGNSRRDTSRTYKFPEYDQEKHRGR